MYGCDTWSRARKEECYGTKCLGERGSSRVRGGWRKEQSKDLHDFHAYLGDQNKDNEVGGTCSRNRRT
jgi:hypothetical protein